MDWGFLGAMCLQLQTYSKQSLISTVHGVHQSKLVTISGSALQRLKTELSKGRLIVFVGHTTFHSTGSQWFLTLSNGVFSMVTLSTTISQGLNTLHSLGGSNASVRGLAGNLILIQFWFIHCKLDTRMIALPVDCLH